MSPRVAAAHRNLHRERLGESLWLEVSGVTATPLSNLDRIFLEEAVIRTKERDPDLWRQAWRSALNPAIRDVKENLDALYEVIWLPVLEGKIGAVAIWGAVVGTAVRGAAAPNDIEVITTPWESWARTTRNIFGDGGI